MKRLSRSLFATLWLFGLTHALAQAPFLQGRPPDPAGELVLDAATGEAVAGVLPVDFVRSPDSDGPEDRGRYLVAVMSGYGLEDDAESPARQSLAVVDLLAEPTPAVVQTVDFPAPQSAQVGAAFGPWEEVWGAYPLYVSGGVENKVWRFRFHPGEARPISPAPEPGEEVDAPAISVAGFARTAPTPRYHENREPVYPLGLAVGQDGNTLYLALNLADSLGIVRDLRGERRLVSVDLREQGGENVYPYGVVALSGERPKVYVSCWATAQVVAVDPEGPSVLKRIAVDRHPTAMLLSRDGQRLYVVHSNADTVSVIDTAADREIERVGVGLMGGERIGASPEGLALSGDGARLYVANAHAGAIAVVGLSAAARGVPEDENDADEDEDDESRVLGFIPTGLYPSAVGVAGGWLFVGNGKSAGFAPNLPDERFPAAGDEFGGHYVVSLVNGHLRRLAEPDPRALAGYTQRALAAAGLVGVRRERLFDGPSPIRHVVYVIKENRTYDQVFGDLPAAGDGTPADGDPSLAIFGAGEAARRPGGPPQDVTPNHRALALRFGLLDRFFVNSEASPDGHNWTTAAFSSDYVDKAFRWQYSGRGRSYDYEGFNRLPSLHPSESAPPILEPPVTAEDVVNYLSRYVPYLQGGRDVAEPESLYLWDAAARAGLTYRNYGEFVGTISAADIKSYNRNEKKPYPDVSPTLATLATKRSLAEHHSPTFRNYDLTTPDAMTVDSYRKARDSGIAWDAVIEGGDGGSRIGAWLEEFRDFVENGDLPHLSLVRLPSDHTAGLLPDLPTPQFYVADNDLALGILVEAVSKSPYWRDTAIVVVEDDAQDGPDHVDAHRSVAMVISAYNRPGALVHEFHNTVSLIRTIELLLGLEPMNALDAAAVPIDLFQAEPDLRPYEAVLPDVALDNLMNPPEDDPRMAYWIRKTLEQDLVHADMADPRALNEIIWASVRSDASPMPRIVRLPAFDAMRFGIASEAEEEEGEDVLDQLRTLLARR